MSQEKISRQRAYQLRRIADGKCSICGINPLFAGEVCEMCADRRRMKQRKAKGCKPWVAGGRGRPPIGSAILHKEKPSEDLYQEKQNRRYP